MTSYASVTNSIFRTNYAAHYYYYLHAYGIHVMIILYRKSMLAIVTFKSYSDKNDNSVDTVTH